MDVDPTKVVDAPVVEEPVDPGAVNVELIEVVGSSVEVEATTDAGTVDVDPTEVVGDPVVEAGALVVVSVCANAGPEANAAAIPTHANKRVNFISLLLSPTPM